MTLTVETIHENGVLKPVRPLPLKERVQVTVHTASRWVSETAGRRRATVPSSAFNRASWAYNFACRR
jgi:predicted DNA-binding antitoxin AbrB/MazE fold protein